MKSPGIIYRRYRQLKRKLLYDRMVKSREICHSNCFYGKTICHGSATDPGFTCFNMCTYDYNLDKNLTLCTCPKECNAFVNVWTKEKTEEKFNRDLADWDTKLKLYPELIALEWVLDKDLTDAIKAPNLVGKLIVSIIMLLEKSLKYINGAQKKDSKTQ